MLASVPVSALITNLATFSAHCSLTVLTVKLQPPPPLQISNFADVEQANKELTVHSTKWQQLYDFQVHGWLCVLSGLMGGRPGCAWGCVQLPAGHLCERSQVVTEGGTDGLGACILLTSLAWLMAPQGPFEPGPVTTSLSTCGRCRLQETTG